MSKWKPNRRALEREILACERCPRLVRHRRRIATEKRRAYRDWSYWGRPVPAFGTLSARLVLVGLAPGAHGANRTGRMFTGDSSGDFLFAALHRHGFASQPTSMRRNDGLRLRDCYITNVVRCAPPENKPSRSERARCAAFFEVEVRLLHSARVFIALGRVAFEEFWKLLGRGTSRPAFGHGAVHPLPGGTATVICSYHPSRQNTQTGRLTREMFDQIFVEARRLVEDSSSRKGTSRRGRHAGPKEG